MALPEQNKGGGGGGGGALTSMRHVTEQLERVQERLDRVGIENLPWQPCLKLYDHQDAFFFCDPPYLNGRQKAYQSWSFAQFSELLDALRNAKGKWMITINDSPEVRRACAGLRLLKVSHPRGIISGKAYTQLCVTEK